MILEIGIVAACINGLCEKVTPAYYAYNPEFVQELEQAKRKIEKKIDYAVVKIAAPIIGAAVAQEASIGINNNFSLVVKAKDDPTVKVIWTF
jgi:flagellar biosynthesis/type III secretory pathway protein FliH